MHGLLASPYCADMKHLIPAARVSSMTPRLRVVRRPCTQSPRGGSHATQAEASVQMRSEHLARLAPALLEPVHCAHSIRRWYRANPRCSSYETAIFRGSLSGQPVRVLRLAVAVGFAIALVIPFDKSITLDDVMQP